VEQSRCAHIALTRTLRNKVTPRARVRGPLDVLALPRKFLLELAVVDGLAKGYLLIKAFLVRARDW